MAVGGIKRKIVYLHHLSYTCTLDPLAKPVGTSQRDPGQGQPRGPLSGGVGDGVLCYSSQVGARLSVSITWEC